MNKPLLDSLAWTIALLLSGIAAGMFLMDFFAYFPVLPRLSPDAAVELHQQAVPIRRVMFRSVIAGSGLAGMVLLIFFSAGVPRRLLIVSLLCLVALVFYTNRVLVPLNAEIATWSPASLPPDWQGTFANMITRERLRSFLPAVAFALELIAFGRARKGAAEDRRT